MADQIETASATMHWKYFRRYFCDAAAFTHDALKLEIKTANDEERRNRYTSAGIIHCALALESAANCCLDILRLPKQAHEDLDQLKTLSKFDTFLGRVKHGTLIDRENVLVRPIRNLISCRNTYVHSKVLSEDIVNRGIEAKFWQPLGLPHNSEYWQPLHAVKVLTILSDFLNYFFFDLCGYPYEGRDGRAIASQILSSGIAALEGSMLPGNVKFSSVGDNLWGNALNVGKEWDLEFAFLGVTSSGPDNKLIYPKRKWGDYSHCKVEELTIKWKPIFYSVPTGFGFILIGDKKTIPKPLQQ